MLTLPGIGILTAMLNFWTKLPSPIKVIIIGLIFGFVCFKMGEHKANVRCAQEKQASIAEAKRIDSAAATAAQKNAEEQAEKYRKQALEAENKVHEATAYYQSLPDACKADSDFISRNNAIGDGSSVPDTVPGDKKRPTSRK